MHQPMLAPVLAALLLTSCAARANEVSPRAGLLVRLVDYGCHGACDSYKFVIDDNAAACTLWPRSRAAGERRATTALAPGAAELLSSHVSRVAEGRSRTPDRAQGDRLKYTLEVIDDGREVLVSGSAASSRPDSAIVDLLQAVDSVVNASPGGDALAMCAIPFAEPR